MIEPGYALTFALATYLLHSTLLSAAVWLLERARILRGTPVREFAWRVALVGAFLTTSLQMAGASTWLVRSPRHVVTLAGAQLDADSPQDARVLRNVSAPVLAAWERTMESATSTATRVLSPWLGRLWRALVPIWLVGAAIGLVRLGFNMLSVARRLRTLRAPPASLAAELQTLCAERQVRTPRLWVSGAWSGPVVLPIGAMIMPAWVADQLDAEQRRVLLAHELAHVVRGDARHAVLMLFLRAIFWMQPWHAFAARRLTALGEWAADDWAARDGRSALRLAESLVECAERLVRRPAPPVGVPMATGGPLLERVERLLEGTSMPLSSVSWPTKVGAMITLLVALLLLPAVRADRLGAEVRSGSSRSRVSVDEDGSTRIELKWTGVALRAESNGRFTVLDDESDLATLDPESRFDLRERRNGLRHEYHVTSDASGALARSYARDGVVRPIDRAAQVWRAEALARMYRDTGHDAAARTKRLLATGGDERVLDEVEASVTDFARVSLLGAFVAQRGCRPDTRERVLAIVQRLPSQRDRADLLVRLIGAPGADAALFASVRAMRGQLDGAEYRRVVEALAQAEQAGR